MSAEGVLSVKMFVVFLVYVTSKPMLLRDSSRAYASCSVQFLF